jgi:NAD(P)-dependent dehydrogenase (short-subunit alcohol dehydrogenase family)
VKYLVTGGNRGLGLAICEYFQGTSWSRENGYDITLAEDRQGLAQASLDCDVFVNNAFDGPFQETWADFAQVHLLWTVASLWQQQQKNGHIINIGSTGAYQVVPPAPGFETYRVSKDALRSHSLQWTEAFRQHQVPFRTTLISPDRLDTELSRGRANWTGNGVQTLDICKYIELVTQTHNNTCVGEIVLWCDLEHKH